MVVGICQLDLYLYGNNSLKGKRQILRHIIDRTKSRFNVSIAEVGDNDLWQSAKIGFSLVGNDSRVINSKLDKIKGFIENMNAAEVYGSEWDIFHF
jgi:hypothetical protein